MQGIGRRGNIFKEAPALLLQFLLDPNSTFLASVLAFLLSGRVRELYFKRDYGYKIVKISTSILLCTLHCKEDPIYVLPEMKLRGLVPIFHIHVSVSDLYIPTIGPPILPCAVSYLGTFVSNFQYSVFAV